MTTKQLERKASELESLITDHRVVRVEHFQGEHLTCTANVDMPEYGIRKGETFHLYASSFDGWFYIVRWDSVWTRHACSCRGYEMRHHCRHADAVKTICTSKYHQSQPVAARSFEDWGDMDAHVEDSIRSGELAADTCVKCSNPVKPGFSLCPWCAGAAAA